MDKGKQPSIFSKYDIDGLASGAYLRQESRKLTGGALEALSDPDSTQVLYALTPNQLPGELPALAKALSSGGLIPRTGGAGAPTSYHYCFEFQFFRPHDTVGIDDLPGFEATTSLIALPLQDEKTVVLFRMGMNLVGEDSAPLGVDDLSPTDNCVCGGVIDGRTRQVRFFQFTKVAGDKVEQELRRRDSTEESGEVVDARVVRPGEESITFDYFSPSSPEYSELLLELRKFIASRQPEEESEAVAGD